MLLDKGVHGCTVRAIATRAGVSKGVLHYYFDDVDEVLDQAMLRAIRAWIAHVAGQAEKEHATPAESFWTAVLASLDPFAHGDRTLMPLWLEYWAACSRSRRTAPLIEAQAILTSYVEGLLAACGVAGAGDTAVAVTAYLLGTASFEAVAPVPQRAIRRHVAALSGLAEPSRPARR